MSELQCLDLAPELFIKLAALQGMQQAADELIAADFPAIGQSFVTLYGPWLDKPVELNRKLLAGRRRYFAWIEHLELTTVKEKRWFGRRSQQVLMWKGQALWNPFPKSKTKMQCATGIFDKSNPRRYIKARYTSVSELHEFVNVWFDLYVQSLQMSMQDNATFSCQSINTLKEI